MPEMSYPGRDALRTLSARARERASAGHVARAALAALDAHGHDLEALARRLDVHNQQIAALQADVIDETTTHTAAELIANGFDNIDTDGFDGIRWTDNGFTECFEVVEAYLAQGVTASDLGAEFVLVTIDGDCDQHNTIANEDHSTAREALAAGLDGADPRVTLLGVTDPTAPAR